MRTFRDYGEDSACGPIKVEIPKFLRKRVKPAKGWYRKVII